MTFICQILYELLQIQVLFNYSFSFSNTKNKKHHVSSNPILSTQNSNFFVFLFLSFIRPKSSKRRKQGSRTFKSHHQPKRSISLCFVQTTSLFSFKSLRCHSAFHFHLDIWKGILRKMLPSMDSFLIFFWLFHPLIPTT